MTISVLGSGSWGTALARLLARGNHAVRLWSRTNEDALALNNKKENSRYLPGIALPSSIDYTTDVHCVDEADIVVIAIPTQHIRSVAKEKFSHLAGAKKIFVSTAKGIELGSLLRVSEVMKDVWSLTDDDVVSLSGPSHAEEVARDIPTAVVAASRSIEQAQVVQETFHAPGFRVYRSEDIIGVEMGGALKNVIAMCAGICDGAGFGDNTKAAVVTRGLAEMSRLGIAMGAEPQTFFGLSGLGDLFVTCASRHSRNRFVGQEIGKGRTLAEISLGMKMVAEGVSTTQSAFDLARKHNVEMPIVREMHSILFEGKNPHDATEALMMRDPKEERK